MAVHDLHCHSTFSDGLLAPADVVRRAAGRGVRVLALTDHDEVAGLPEAREEAQSLGLDLVAGCEISVTWESRTLHVVGLRIDAANEALSSGLAGLRDGRRERARRIAAALAEAGIPGAYEGARRHAGSERLISRTHFARFLVEAGHQRDVASVFKRYLTAGKPGHVRHAWATLAEAIGWIRGAGGIAVLAHPGRYDVSPTALRRLVAEFRDHGGDAIEVLSSAHTRTQSEVIATLARVHGLLASSGSDWHGPGESWLDLGALPDLPAGAVPVWSRW